MVELRDHGIVEFRFFRPNARAVFLCGDFNDWRNDQLAMSRHDNGYWVARLKLPAGEYRFRYCADGMWYTDFAAFGVEPDRFGLNSVLRVPEPRLVMADSPEAQTAIAAA